MNKGNIVNLKGLYYTNTPVTLRDSVTGTHLHTAATAMAKFRKQKRRLAEGDNGVVFAEGTAGITSVTRILVYFRHRDMHRSAVQFRTAKEQVRVEDLQYRSGDNTSTDVINAEAALIRSRADNCQARFDRRVAVASLKKAMGLTDMPANPDAGVSKREASPASPGRSVTEETK